MNGLFRWMRAHWVLTTLAVIVVSGGALHFGLEWHGQREWEVYAAQARARGVKLTEAEVSRPEIPADQNFAEIPMLRGGAGNNPFKFPTATKGPPGMGNPRQGIPIDWMAWQSYFQRIGWLTETTADPVADVLRAMEHFAPGIEEWRQWRTRPQCRFPVGSKSDFVAFQPIPAALFSTTEVFGLRLRAHLAQGDSSAAYTDLEDQFQAYRTLEKEPGVVKAILRLGSMALWVSAVGSGLRDHAWKEEELSRIALFLDGIHLRADYCSAMESERRAANDIFEKMLAMPFRQRGETVLQIYWTQPLPKFIPPSLAPIGGGLVPRWVYRENQLRTNQLVDATIAQVSAAEIELDARLPVPEAVQTTGTRKEAHLLFFELMAEAYSSVVTTYFKTQALLQQAKTAVALERAWLARGAYPESLSALVPEYLSTLPPDNYSGKPLIYRRTGERTFVLYSVGENQQDDGGPADGQNPGSNPLDIVWRHAPMP